MQLVVNYYPNHGIPRHCKIDVAEKDIVGLSEKQLWDRFIGPAECALINWSGN